MGTGKFGRALPYAGAVAVPLGSGVLLHWWAGWSLRSPLGTPTALAVLVGLLLAGLAVVAHNALFREGGSILALLVLLAGLGAVWVEARDARVRGATASCVVVGKVRVTDHPTFGEGAPRAKRLHHHTLDCPDGGPKEFSWERRLGDTGSPVRIAYDPAGRMDPVPADENTARGAPYVPAGLLLLAAGLSAASVRYEGTGRRIW
ncbi:hypothetical protein [Streptomyces sp. CC208A]|uniref:hypothetical protein n=1 Tax=Streptomyces sp. CC208A TaxID=3044573 RepID=UPI0024A87700|nr:hypothetical protein [Streptomyces sp. CC208A]